MSAANGNATAGPTTMTGARPVVLLRYRPGVSGAAARTVHLVSLPLGGRAVAGGVALCGVLLCPDQVEMVTPGHGMPCSFCMVNHISAIPRPAPADVPAMAPPTDETASDTRSLAAAVAYQAWGWPVTQRRDQVWLSLEPDTVALIFGCRSPRR